MRSDVRTRWANRDDAHAVGLLALDGLEDAPSSEVGVEDVYTDPREFGEQLLGGAASILVAEVGGGVLAAIRIVPREFIRASHVAELALLVHPSERGRGLGVALLDDAMDKLREEGRFTKVVMRVAADDRALAMVLKRSACTWRLERIERAALCRDGQLVDMHLFALLFEIHSPGLPS